jgi:hypothetical protein
VVDSLAEVDLARLDALVVRRMGTRPDEGGDRRLAR